MEQKNNSIVIAGAIIIAGFLVALGIFASKDTSSTPGTTGTDVLVESPIEIEPISADDHIRGSRDAAVTLVEYSDIQCPFCQQFHGEVIGASEALGDNFAWVYRNFPLDQIHPRARSYAIAAECVAQSGGDSAYWTYLDALIGRAQSADVSDEELVTLATTQGINSAAFNACFDNPATEELVQSDLDDALRAGGQGTPFNVFVLKEELTDEQREALTTLFREPGSVNVSPDGMRLSVGGGFPQDMLVQIVNILAGNTGQ